MRMTSFLIEGNIGCGKSTLLGYLSEKPQLKIVNEPIQVWTNFRGRFNLLQNLYDDPTSWFFPFQAFVMNTLVENRQKHSDNNLINCYERSILSSRYVFTNYAYQNNHITEVQYNMLDYMFNVQCEDQTMNHIIYMQCDPVNCYTRLKIRDRSEERSVTQQYLAELDKFYNCWLIDNTYSTHNATVHVIDANADEMVVLETVEKIIDSYI
jgi:deoxyadenosine/deoxycytidine kinase